MHNEQLEQNTKVKGATNLNAKLYAEKK